VSLALVGGCTAALVAQNGLSGLGVNEVEARREIVYALEQGRVNVYPARAAFKAAAPSARAALVTAAMTWAKAYTESPAFRADYEKQRAQAAPKPLNGKSADQELAKQRAERNKGIEEAKKNLAKMPPEVRAQMEAAIKQMEAMGAQQDAVPQMAAMMRQGAEAQVADEKRQYDEAVARYQKRYPAEPRLMVAQRLREFLTVSQDVDFSAKLVPAGGKQRFANPDYEVKSSEWKLCYRAGKEAVDAARAFATTWLRAIEGK
jgi:hypothetical protein